MVQQDTAAPEAASQQDTPTSTGPAGDRPAPGGDRREGADRRDGGGRPQAGGGRPRGRYAPKRRVCQFCVDKVKEINYKDISRLRRFVSDRGKIEPRRKTSTCASHQRELAEALKRARHLALIPYTGEHVRSTGFFPQRG